MRGDGEHLLHILMSMITDALFRGMSCQQRYSQSDCTVHAIEQVGRGLQMASHLIAAKKLLEQRVVPKKATNFTPVKESLTASRSSLVVRLLLPIPGVITRSPNDVASCMRNARNCDHQHLSTPLGKLQR
jgi:hypothetical protein